MIGGEGGEEMWYQSQGWADRTGSSRVSPWGPSCTSRSCRNTTPWITRSGSSVWLLGLWTCGHTAKW